MSVALVVTVLNEASTIDALLESVAGQTRRPDEIVIVDGGSRDDTRERLAAWADRLPLRVLEAPGANIAAGRNIAIGATDCEVVAVTDAGVRLAPDWLEQLCACLQDNVDVVGGFFRPDARTTFERAMGATVLPALEDVDPGRFLPSSRSVLFCKRAWAAVGGYPEWLDYCEDVVFDRALKRAGVRFAFAPGAVAWFRPRGTFASFFVQYYRYARGDGKAGLWWHRHAIRYITYAAAVMLLRRGAVGLGLLLVGAVAYTRRPYERLDLRGLSTGDALQALALVPAIRLVGDVAKMLGYPVGVAWRLERVAARASTCSA